MARNRPAEAEIRQLVVDHFGEDPTLIEYMAFGHSNATYTVTLASSQVIVRTNSNGAAFDKTSSNIETLGSLGLPVPSVIAYDISKSIYPFAYILLDAIPGRDLRYELDSMSHEQITTLAEQLVGYQKLVNALPKGQGYGYTNIGEKADFNSWIDVVKHNIPSWISDPEIDIWGEKCGQLVDSHADYLTNVPATCFLDDITGKNVIIENGRLQGLIDFDCVCYGDPLWWISLTTVGIVCDLDIPQLFYTDELCRLWMLTNIQTRCILPLYCAIMGIQFYLRDAKTASPEWRCRMSTIIEQWLAQARKY